MVVFHPGGAMFPSQSTWNNGDMSIGELGSSLISAADFHHQQQAAAAALGVEQLQDNGTNQQPHTPQQHHQLPPLHNPNVLSSVAHMFKQTPPDDPTEYMPEAKRLAYAPSPFVNKSPGSPYCENGSISSSPMSVAAAASSLEAYHQALQPQQHPLDPSAFDQSVVRTNDLACGGVATAAGQLAPPPPGHYSSQQQQTPHSDPFNAVSPFTQHSSTPGHPLTPNAAAMLAQQPPHSQQSQHNDMGSHVHSAAMGGQPLPNVSQLTANYPPMTGSPRNYLTPSPIGSAAGGDVSSAALNRYASAAAGGGTPLYSPQSLANQASRPLSPVIFAHAHGPPPPHYLHTGLPTHQMMSSMVPHPSQFHPQAAAAAAAHGLGPASLMRMGFPYRYPPSPYFDFRSGGHPPSPYHTYHQLSNGPNAPPFFRDEFIKPGRKSSGSGGGGGGGAGGAVFAQMQTNEVITLGDVCDMKEPDDLSKIVLANCDELLEERGGVKDFATRVLEIESRLCFSLLNLRLSDPVMYIYNPLDYARQIHQTFVLKWGSKPKRVLFLGMNPGPFGMAQNGIPFGDGQFVKNFLKLEKGTVTKPAREHPKRPIWGLECPQREVSGSRFWSLVQSISGHPDAFFDNCYVYNYCPLVFLGMSGKNITPPSLGSSAREPLLQACDKALVDIVNLMGIEKIVAVGRFVEERSKLVLKTANREDVEVIFIMHPSPINPKANAGWEGIVKGQLEEAKIAHFFPHFYNPIPVTFSTTAQTTQSTSASGSSTTSNGPSSTGTNTTAAGSRSTTSGGTASSQAQSQSSTKVSHSSSKDTCIVSASAANQHSSSNSTSSLKRESGGDSSSRESGTRHGAAGHSLVGQLSIASEASTFADEFIKAEVTITSNQVANHVQSSQSRATQQNNAATNNNNRPGGPKDSRGGIHTKQEPHPDPLAPPPAQSAGNTLANCNVKQEPGTERSAIDHLIASTQAQQHHLSLNHPYANSQTSPAAAAATAFQPGSSQSPFHTTHNQQGMRMNGERTGTGGDVGASGDSSQQHVQVADQQQRQQHANHNLFFGSSSPHQVQHKLASFQSNMMGAAPQLPQHTSPSSSPHPYLGGYGHMPHIMQSPHSHFHSFPPVSHAYGHPSMGPPMNYATGAEMYHNPPTSMFAQHHPHLMQPPGGHFALNSNYAMQPLDRSQEQQQHFGSAPENSGGSGEMGYQSNQSESAGTDAANGMNIFAVNGGSNQATTTQFDCYNPANNPNTNTLSSMLS